MSEIIKSQGAWLCFVPPGGKETVLTSQEAQILRGIKSPRRRRDWLAGRWAAKELVRNYLLESRGIELSLDQIEIVNDELGAPAVACGTGLTLSIAHSAGHALAGLCERDCIGVDLQEIRPVHPRLRERALTSTERAQCPDQQTLLIFWAIKEATIKAQRARPAPSVREIEVTLTRPGKASVCAQGQELAALWGRRGDFVWACVTRSARQPSRRRRPDGAELNQSS